eukprot:TRINITY_DN91412_c0_g1_i1.p1 TRINITY_DN91412_c0_g1~~TRINITY_DN91412_c0_g1_i1.p1  ORF type:complete len:729 (-),score=156.93 TRINITY_DN91412_c0_g1_i1:169-2355(-)
MDKFQDANMEAQAGYQNKCSCKSSGRCLARKVRRSTSLSSMAEPVQAVGRMLADDPATDAGDMSFMAVSCALVLLMTPGLAFYYGGLVKEKNILNTMMMSVISMGLISFYWILFGFSYGFSWSDKYMMYKGLTMMIWPATKITGLLFATYQMTFAIITVALISGSIVERMRFAPYLVFITIWFAVVYIPLCYWVWGGGWIFQMGAKDFAGGTVVHISSGTSGYTAAMLLGKRKNTETTPNNVPFVILGGGLLWFGWTGFNGGSALAANWLAGLAVTTTFLAAAVAMVTWLALEIILTGKPTAVGSMTGAVAGLVGITPVAGFVSATGALAVGAITAAVCTGAVKAAERLRLVDDTLDCFTVHGVGGYTGGILGGFFDTSAGILYGHGPKLLKAQFVGVSAGLVYSFVATAIIFTGLKAIFKVRAADSVQERGLDKISHDEDAYARKEYSEDDSISFGGSMTMATQPMMMMSREPAKQSDLGMLLCCANQPAPTRAQMIMPSSQMSGYGQVPAEDPVIDDEAGESAGCWPGKEEEEYGRGGSAASRGMFAASLDVMPTGQDLGLMFDPIEEPDGLVIAGLVPGAAVDRYNSSTGKNKINVGDTLVGINGMAVSAASIYDLASQMAGQMVLNVRPGNVFTANIDKQNGPLGVAIDSEAPPECLGIRIQDVTAGGAVSAWNAKQKTNKVKAGDRIVGANGRADPQGIMMILQQAPKLDLKVLSSGQGGSWW